MKKSKGTSVSFKDAFAKFLSENRDLRTEYHCEVLLDLSSKLLIARTADEIAVAERFVGRLYQDHAEVVEALNIALDEGLPAGHVGFNNGKKHEYLAVQTRLIVGRIRHMMQPSLEGETFGDANQLMVWAESQAGKAIEAAIEAYIDFLFPGRLDDLMLLLDLGVTGLLRRLLGDLYTSILPAAEPYFQKILETPGLLDLLGVGVKELQRKAKSEAASKAGSAPKPENPQKILAIERYKAKKWKSALQAAKVIHVEVAKMPGNRLSEARGEKTVQEWILEYQKSNKQLD